MALHSWPDVPEEHRWVFEAMEESFSKSTRSPDEMRARARELREYAAGQGPFSGRDAALELADRWEAEAAARLSAR